MEFDEGVRAVDEVVTEAVQLIGAKTMRGMNPDETCKPLAEADGASETGEFEDWEVRPVWKYLRCRMAASLEYIVHGGCATAGGVVSMGVAYKTGEVRGIVRSIAIVAILILLLVQPMEAVGLPEVAETPIEPPPETEAPAEATLTPTTSGSADARNILVERDRITIASGGSFDLEDGYTFIANQIDLEGGKVWLTLSRDGKEIDSAVLSVGDTYTYTKNIDGEDHPLVTEKDSIIRLFRKVCESEDHLLVEAKVDAVFRGTDSNIVQLVSIRQYQDISKAEAQSAITSAKSAISQEKSKGFNMADVETLLYQAEDLFGNRDYVIAKELAETARDWARSAPSSENAIAEVESVIQQEESKGFNPVEAESLLSQAEEAFSTGDYIKANELADKAKDHSLDIDQDGVSNDADFAPTINNYLIYAGAAILLVVSVIAIITGFKAIQNFKLERERKEERRREQEREERERLRQEAEERREAERRKEQEHIRAEEEKRRREEKEKRRLERKKQDILDEIDEVTNER